MERLVKNYKCVNAILQTFSPFIQSSPFIYNPLPCYLHSLDSQKSNKKIKFLHFTLNSLNVFTYLMGQQPFEGPWPPSNEGSFQFNLVTIIYP